MSVLSLTDIHRSAIIHKKKHSGCKDIQKCARAQWREQYIFMKISQQVLAEIAGVSRGTVDRVLHGRPNVKPETREKVLEAIEKMQYSPNAAGRALALSNRTFSICAVLPDNPYFSDVFTGIRSAAEELRDYNFSVEYIITNGMTSGEIARAIDESSAMALMVAVSDSPEIRDCICRKKESGVPVVTFNTDLQDCGRLCFVGQNLYKSGRIAASLMCKLLQKAQNTILIVTGSTSFQAHRARISGFRDVLMLSEKKMEIIDIVETNDDRTMTYNRMMHALTQNSGIDGIYISAGQMDVCVQVLREIGRKYSIVVNDLTPAVADALKSNILDFAIFQDPFEQGYRPVRVLFDILFNGQNPAEEYYYTDNTIITSEMLD